MKQPDAQGLLSGTTVSFFGPAYNAAKADVLLGYLQDRDAATNPQNIVLTLQNHIADPVGGWIGGNPATGGVIPEGSNWIIQAVRAMAGQKDTSHNCYGASPETCSGLWGGPGKKPVSVIINSNGRN